MFMDNLYGHFFISKENFLLQKIWRFQTLWMSFQASNFTPIFSQGVLFCPRRYFFENLPLFKGKYKGKWKKPKNREKKVQSPEKNLPLILFWPRFLTHRPIFLTFWDFVLPPNPITSNHLFLSNSFPFSPPTPYLFSHKTNPNFSSIQIPPIPISKSKFNSSFFFLPIFKHFDSSFSLFIGSFCIQSFLFERP